MGSKSGRDTPTQYRRLDPSEVYPSVSFAIEWVGGVKNDSRHYCEAFESVGLIRSPPISMLAPHRVDNLTAAVVELRYCSGNSGSFDGSVNCELFAELHDGDVFMLLKSGPWHQTTQCMVASHLNSSHNPCNG